MSATTYLQRPDGRVAYDVRGEGPLVVCVPGVGDVRDEYRFLTPLLLDAGFRVATVDLRGHGESDASFGRYDRPAVGDDVVALLEELDAGPAHLVGTSLGAAAVVWAAAEAPERVASLTLIGPFVRDVPVAKGQELALRVLLARPWGPAAWSWWYRKLYPSRRPDDLDAYRRGLRRNLSQPGRFAAVRELMFSSCEAIDPRLDELTVPARVVVGTADPDFPDPAAEADEVARRLGGEVLLVEGAGHYPHAERPDVVGPDLVAFLTGLRATT